MHTGVTEVGSERMSTETRIYLKSEKKGCDLKAIRITHNLD